LKAVVSHILASGAETKRWQPRINLLAQFSRVPQMAVANS
jgi:hypothetical protein